MSGSVYGNWPLKSNQLDLAKKQAKLVGCTDETSTGIVKCLREKSADEIANSLAGLKVNILVVELVFLFEINTNSCLLLLFF